MKICFVTSENTSNLTESDKILFQALKTEGFKMSVQVWSDPSVVWKEFNCIIIRSCWDYHLRLEEFISWINRIESLGVKMCNPCQIVKPNLNKSYLRVLAESGIQIVPSLWIDSKDPATIVSEVAQKGWDEIILKPNVGATAHEVVKLKGAELAKFLDTKPYQEYIFQKYLPEIKTNGEWSIIFFGRNYSHSVIKKADPQDFRVQYEYGGNHQKANPDFEIVKQAARIVAYYPDDLLYARIDGIQIGNQFYLMEAELTEPELFISSKSLAEGFVDRLKVLINKIPLI